MYFFSVKEELNDDDEEKKSEKVKKEPLSLEELMAKRQAEEMARSKVHIYFMFCIISDFNSFINIFL